VFSFTEYGLTKPKLGVSTKTWPHWQLGGKKLWHGTPALVNQESGFLTKGTRLFTRFPEAVVKDELPQCEESLREKQRGNGRLWYTEFKTKGFCLVPRGQESQRKVIWGGLEENRKRYEKVWQGGGEGQRGYDSVQSTKKKRGDATWRAKIARSK